VSNIKKSGCVVEAQACADLVGLDLVGDNIKVTCVAQLKEIRANSLRFVNIFKDQNVHILNQMEQSLVIALPDYLGKLNIPHIISDDPKLHFCIIANKFFAPEINSNKIEKTARLGENISIGQNVYIGHNTVIEDNVVIGTGSVILHNVVISKNCKVGKECLIKSGSIIGQRGFGFQRDLDNIPISFPHYGAVLIGNNVEIGASNTIASGSLGNTVIEDNVKLDDQVHIAHNVLVGEGTLITACAEISGSVKIGKNCYIGPNSAIKNGLNIGNNVFVGIAAVVTKSINDDGKVVGNPAKSLIR
jgi:UDP-3-O-[3-hydroxymyristoyl] glucosamine N-acyltransferase LpxD